MPYIDELRRLIISGPLLSSVTSMRLGRRGGASVRLGNGVLCQ